MINVELLTFGTTTVGLAPIERSLPPRQSEREAARAVASYLLQRPVDIDHHHDGAPFISDFHGCVSISHSQKYIAVAIDNQRSIGIDIEDIDRAERMMRIAPRVLSPEEIHAYAEPQEQLRAWTLKEAAYKAARHGVDFLHHIQLPTDGSNVLVVCGDELSIVASEVRDDIVLSLVTIP